MILEKVYSVITALHCITETEMSSFWRNFHHWLHRKLSKWQLSVQSVIKISSKWQHFRFSDNGFTAQALSDQLCKVMSIYGSQLGGYCRIPRIRRIEGYNGFIIPPLVDQYLPPRTHFTKGFWAHNPNLVKVYKMYWYFFYLNFTETLMFVLKGLFSDKSALVQIMS